MARPKIPLDSALTAYLRNQGFSTREIATKLRVSPATVCRVLKQTVSKPPPLASTDKQTNGVPGATRTRDPLLRRQLLYPTELQGQTSRLPCLILASPR